MEAIEERTEVPLEIEEDSGAEYRQFRELLLGGEQRQLNVLNNRLLEIQNYQHQLHVHFQALHANSVELAQRLNALEHGDEFVAKHLPAAFQLREWAGEISRKELADALKGSVGESLRQCISENPEGLAETLEPVVSPAVNHGIWSVFEESGLQKLVRFRPDGSTKLALPVAVLTCLLLVALTGWLAYSIKENVLLNQAVGALRAEEGIIVSLVENPVLGKPRIVGLRDPLAPDPAEVLQREGVSSDNFAIELQPFHSVGTVFDHQREQDRVKEMEAMRREIIAAIDESAAAKEEVPVVPASLSVGPPDPEN